MSIGQHTLSHLLRNSGAVLDEVEHRDVELTRRDGPNIIISTVSREAAVRDALQMATRTFYSVLARTELRDEAMSALEDALPWVSWLPFDDRSAFADAFVRTVRACSDTQDFEPLARTLNRWKATAELANNPELLELVTLDDTSADTVPLARPET